MMTNTSPQELHRELKVTDAAAFSIGLIGPVGALALLGAGAAGILGKGATWAFIFALIGVGLVAYGFVKLSRHIAHTGSVYATVGLTLGPRAGFVAGWALFLAYATIGAGSTIEIGFFLTQLFADLGVGFHPDWLIVAVIALIVVVLVARSKVHVITRVLLVAELVGAALVTILNIVVLVRLGVGSAPGGRHLSWDFLALPAGTGIGTIGAAAVFGFLAFAGFEGAATLGEETSKPKRDIPKAITIAVVIVGAFYLLSIISQTLGYGMSAADVKRFVNAGAPYGDLGRAFVGPWLADLLTLLAVISLFAISIGTLSGASRVLFALGRGAGVRGGITKVSKSGSPIFALLTAAGVSLIAMIIERATGAIVLDATFWVLTIGTISLLVAYLLATVGAIRFLFFGGNTRTPKWQIIIPILAAAFVIYTLYRNVVGVDSPYGWFPPIVAVWLIIGIAISFRQGLVDRVRANLDGADTTPLP